MTEKLTTIVVNHTAGTSTEMLFSFPNQKAARRFARENLYLSVKDAQTKDEDTRFFYIFTLDYDTYLGLRGDVQRHNHEVLTAKYLANCTLEQLQQSAHQSHLYPSLGIKDINDLKTAEDLAKDLAWLAVENISTVGWVTR